jgi:hypothetical protein
MTSDEDEKSPKMSLAIITCTRQIPKGVESRICNKVIGQKEEV